MKYSGCLLNFLSIIAVCGSQTGEGWYEKTLITLSKGKVMSILLYQWF